MIAKRTYLVIISLCISGICFSQGSFAQTIKQKISVIERNFDLLSKDRNYTSSIFSIGKDKISVVDPTSGQVEFVLYNEEIQPFLQWFDSLDYHKILELYSSKGRSKFSSKEAISPNVTKDKIKIAIDPGHFAGTMSEAIYEDRYVKYRFDSANQDTFINESSLNFDIAYLLKDMLDKAGYETMITRNFGTSAVYMSFETWMENEYKYAIRNLMANDEISMEQANEYLLSKDRKKLFNEVYSYIDFKERAKRINAFNPDLTIVIHLNAFEYGGRDDKGYSSLTHNNYSMAFVPGAFMKGELDKVDQRIDFLRLLVSDNISQSLVIGDLLLKETESELNVPRHTQNVIYSQMVKSSSNFTGIEGLYARNLYMTRAIESPVVYGETILQDNSEEFLKLASVDFKKGNIRTSERVNEVALSYFEAIQKFYSLK